MLRIVLPEFWAGVTEAAQPPLISLNKIYLAFGRIFDNKSTHPNMGSLKKRRKAKINKHKRRKKLRLNRHKKRTWQK
jgi:hypothetical protein